ncbi:MAG: P-II family nitrogen regulator [Planctomycetota bacterium]
MRLIIALIQPTKFVAVQQALAGMPIDEIVVGDALGYGRQRGRLPTFRGNTYSVDLLRKITLQIGVADQHLEKVLEVLQKTALSGAGGEIGDGKIFVLPILEELSI